MRRKSIPSKRDGGAGKCPQAGWCKFLSQTLESNHLEPRNQAATKGPSLSGAVVQRKFRVTSALVLDCAMVRWSSHQGRGRNHPCIPGDIQSAGTFLLQQGSCREIWAKGNCDFRTE